MEDKRLSDYDVLGIRECKEFSICTKRLIRTRLSSSVYNFPNIIYRSSFAGAHFYINFPARLHDILYRRATRCTKLSINRLRHLYGYENCFDKKFSELI